MKYVLIDSCILRHLVDTNGFSKYIIELENLINNNEIRLITHKVIIEEWEKHKVKWKKEKENKNKKTSSQFIIFQDSIFIENQFEKISTLVKNSYQILETPDIINSEYAKRQKEKLAPFITKKDSLSDWEIIGSACHYCEFNNIKELVFISDNHTDFADEKNIKNIHPSLSIRFKQLSINYFKNYTDFFDEIDLTKNNSIFEELKLSEISLSFSYNANIKKNILDSICSLYKDMYNEIDFIPLHILKKSYPFTSNEDKFTHYSIFELSYVNDKVSDFFSNLKIKNEEIKFKNEELVNGIPKYIEKTKFILSKLTNNLIYNIRGIEQKGNTNIFYNYLNIHSSIGSAYNKLKFNDIFEWSIDFKHTKEKLEWAYYNYLVGNFSKANLIYEEITEMALKNNEFITYFIAKYNQKHLINFLNNPLKNKLIDKLLIEELKKIDPVEIAVKFKTKTAYNLLLFIAQEDFFTEGFQNILDEKNKIIEHYYIQLNGGWSNNNHVWNLIEEFVKIESFLNSNFIIYNKFTNYYNLFDVVIEGLFAAHAMKDSQRYFTIFDDYWIQKIIFYGNKESILKHFNRYQLKFLKYETSSNSNEKESFIELAENLIC